MHGLVVWRQEVEWVDLGWRQVSVEVPWAGQAGWQPFSEQPSQTAVWPVSQPPTEGKTQRCFILIQANLKFTSMIKTLNLRLDVVEELLHEELLSGFLIHTGYSHENN